MSRSFLLEPLEERVLLSALPITGGIPEPAPGLESSAIQSGADQTAHFASLSEEIDGIFEGGDDSAGSEALFNGVSSLEILSPDGSETNLQIGNDPIVVQEDEILKGNGDSSRDVLNQGVISPGSSPGVQNFPTFTQTETGLTLIEIGGTGGPGANPNGHDRINVAGLASLDGALQIQLINGFVPVAGNSFTVMTWGSRSGEFANWLGTASVPGQPQLAFKPVYSGSGLTLQVIETPIIIPGAQSAIDSGLNTLSQIGNLLESAGDFADDLPFIGESLGELIDLGGSIHQAIRGQLTSLLSALPRESDVTRAIEAWDGATVAGFTINVNGVLGTYGNVGTDPFWWDVDLDLTPTALNRALQNLAESALGAVFNSAPTVQVETKINLDFSFGYDGGFFVDINDVTASAEVHASGLSGFGFNFPGHGGLSVTNGSVDLEAAVTVTPDAGVLTGGRINSTSLSQIASGTIPIGDAFNLTESGSLHAEFTLASNLTGFGFSFSGTTTVKVDAPDLFNDEDPKFEVEVDGTLTILNQILQGVFTFKDNGTETILEAENVTIELKAGAGGGATRILRVENGSGQFVLLGNDLAGTASLTIAQGPAIPNISIAGTTLSLAINTSSAAVPTIDGETVDLPAGPYFRLEGHAIVSLTTPAVQLEGDFLYEPADPTPGSPNSGDEVVTAAVTNVNFSLGSPSQTFLSVTDAEAILLFRPTGLVASGEGTVGVNIGGVSLSSDASFLLNDTNTAYNASLTINGNAESISVPAGPYLRVEAENTSLDILGVGLSGDFVFEKKQTGVGAEHVLTIAASDVAFSLGDQVNELITINGGIGAFILDENGLAGQATVSIALGVSGVTASGTFKVEINTKNVAVSESVTVGGSTININQPAGPYLKISGTGVTLAIGGISMTGDFSFEERTTAGGLNVIRVEAHNVDFDFGTNILTATNGEALFVITNAGVAGQGSIDAGLNVFGESFTHTFDWSFNTMAAPFDDDLNPVAGAGGASPGGVTAHSLPIPSGLDLPEGPFNRLSTGGPIPFSINVAGQPQSITAALVLTLVPGASPYITVGVSSFSLTLGAGPVSLAVSGGIGAFYIKQTGIAGNVEVASATLTGATGITVSAENLSVEFNNTGADVGTATTPVTISVSDDEADDVELQFVGTYYHNFLAISGSAELNLAGLVTLGGDFRFEKSGSTIKVAVEELHFDLKAGTHTVASFHNGEGVFVINAGGIAGRATLDFEAGIIGLSGTISLEVNTTASAVNTTVATPSGNQTINLSGTQYLRVYVNGHLLLGPAALPYNFYVQVNTSTGAVEVRQTSDNSLLVSVDSSGNISTGITIPDFSRPNPFEFVSMLRQLVSWLAGLRESSAFDIEIPFTNGKTLGDVFDFSKVLVDELYSFMVSVELQSRSISPTAAHTGPLNNARAKLRLGTETPVEIVVSDTIGNPNTRTMAELVTLANNAIAAAGLTARVQARINQRNSDNPSDDIFVIALTPEEIAKGTTLNLVDLNSQFQALGFGPADATYGDAGDVTAEQVGVLVERYDTPGFIVALGAKLGVPVTYDPARRIYTYTFNESGSFSHSFPFDFGGELGDIAEASLIGTVGVTGSIGLNFTIGFDLSAREVPRILSSSLIPAPSTGRISDDAHFIIYVNDSTGIPLTLTKASTSTNNSVDDLAADLNALFATATYNGLPLNRYVIAQRASNGLAISGLNEDTNGNGTLDAGEDKNSSGALENQLGIVDRLVIRSAINDTFATELGFGNEAVDLDGVTTVPNNDSFFQSASNSTIKGLFIENAEISAQLEITTTTPISGSVKFGFVEISTNSGTIETVGPDGETAGPISLSISLEDQTTGNDRFYLADLFGGLSLETIGNMIEGPTLTGGIKAELNNISVGGLGFSMPLGSNPKFSIYIPDLNVLEFNPEPYNGTNKGIFLTYPNIGQLANFASLNFSTIIQALNIIADNLSTLSAFSFLDEKLPFVNMSINEMIDYAAKFAELIDAASSGGSSTLQETIAELKEQIDALFNLDPSVLTIGLDDNGVAGDVTTSGGVNGSTASQAVYNLNGLNNALIFRNEVLANAASLNGSRIRIIGSSTITDNTAKATWDAAAKVLTIEVNGGVTTANSIIAALASVPEWTAVLPPTDTSVANNGNGVITTTALKFIFNFTTGYANSLPFQLDLRQLVDSLGLDNSAARDFLEAATTLIQISGSGNLTVSASATLRLAFGLDVTNPGTAKPFFYDGSGPNGTGIELLAKVLGTNIDIEASLGSVLGIYIKDGTVTIDADGDPETGPGQGDRGAKFVLGLKDNNGDGRHYLSENWFNGDSINLEVQGGVSARLPIFAPFESNPLGGDSDSNGDGYPDNELVINIPDLVRLFINDKASGNSALIKFAGNNNDFTVTSSAHSNYEVVFVNNPGIAPSASFSGNTLTVNISTGITTGTQIVNAIKAVPTFNATALTSDDDGNSATTTNNGTGRLNKITIITPDLSSLFEDIDLCAILDSSAGLLLDGLDSLLGKIQDGLNDLVASLRLPLIGDGLAGAADFISQFRNGLLRELRTAIDTAGSATAAIENALKRAFWNTLGPGGLDLLIPWEGGVLDESLGYSQLAVTLDCDEGLVVRLRLAKDLALLDTSANPIDIDIGIPGFGLEVSGNVQVSIGFDLKFGFGLNMEDGFYFDSSAGASDPELQLYFRASIPGLNAKGQLLFLQLDVADDSSDPSYFNGGFYVDLKDPNGDGKLTFAEITGSGTEFSDIIEARIGADAEVNLKLAASFGGDAAFPRVLADFHLIWHFDLENGAGAPQISFTNIALDLGSFLSEFLAPILEQIRKITEPFQPIIDIVTARLPVISDLAGEDITLLKLAGIFGLLEPSTVDFIEDVLQVVKIINTLEGLGEGTILIPFGSFALNQDSSGQMRNITPIQSFSNIDLGQVVAGASGPGVSTTYQNQVSEFAGDVGALSNFKIPIFENPSELFNLFIGEPVRLIEWRMPQFKFLFEYTQKIPIYPPLYAQFGGSVGATIDIGFGYDTYGIQKFIEAEDKNALDLLDGFYVIDFDASGNEQNELELTGEIFAGASINLLIAEAGVRGGITATIGFDLNDINDDGKVRVSEIIANALQDPRCIFNIHGELGLFLEAFLTVDLFFFSISEEWRFADITLVEFSILCPEPILAEQTGTSLTLNIGSRAHLREEIDTTDNSETFIVKHVSGTAGNETVEVIWGNYKKEFTGIAKIIVPDAGQGDDYIDLRGTLAEAEVHGGVGNDTIYLGNGNNSVAHGDAGKELITAGAGTGTILYGGDGNDTFVPGAVAIEIHGGAGNDLITGTAAADKLYGDDGADIIDAGDGDDLIEGGDGNDVIEAGVGNDKVIGGKGNDTLRGGRGNDIVEGGEGDDYILGAVGNDFLVGGDGNDRILGHGGMDLILGDNYSQVNSTTITTANITSILAAISTTGVSVQGIAGTGNDFLVGGGTSDVIFGAGGNDFLYGGNFFENGETEVIEEDGNDFLDGGAGDDTIFGDDSMGKTGDRDTGIAIKSGVWYDLDLDGVRDADEKGFAGVTVSLYKQSDNSLIGTETTDAEGNFEFVGLDPLNYYIRFSLPATLSFTTKYNSGAVKADEKSDDSDADATGKTDAFYVGFNETEAAVAAGYTGPSRVSISDVSVEEANSGETEITFVITLSGPQPEPVEIDWATVDGTATATSGDYVSASGTVVFAEGELRKEITITILGDNIYENNEQFEFDITRAQLMRSVPANLPLSSSTILGTIVNDDPIPSIVIEDSIPELVDHDNNTATDPIYIEGRPVKFLVTLSNPSQFPITVEYRVDSALNFHGIPLADAAKPSPLFPLAQADFNLPLPGMLTFTPGVTKREIIVTTINDSLDEPEEKFFVDLFNPTFARIGDSRGYGIIPDDDVEVSVSIKPAVPVGGTYRTEVNEGNSGIVKVDLVVELSQASGKTVVVTYSTAPGTAVGTIWSASAETRDYIPTAGTLTFAPGETVKTFSVEIEPDNRIEGDESFFVNLIIPSNAEIARASSESNHVEVEIVEDDTVPNVDHGPWSIGFGALAYTVQEPDSGTTYAVITLSRTPGSSHALAVVTTSNGTATAGPDYGSISRTLVRFEGNETIKTVLIPIYSDSIVEGNETVFLSLRNPTGGPVKAAPGTATLTITDGDTPTATIEPPLLWIIPTTPAIKIYGVTEGSTGALTNRGFTVNLSAPAGPGGVTIHYESVSITARAPSDYTTVAGMLFIPAGSSSGTINVPVREDTAPELSETFAVRMTHATGALLDHQTSGAVATIYDDDLKEVTGRVYYDSNGNGIRDLNEKGIAGVDVRVTYMSGAAEVATTVTTDANGIYKANVLLGPVNIAVDGETVTSPFKLFLIGSGEYETTTFNENQSVEFEGIVGISPFEDVGYKNSFTFSAPTGTKDVGRGGTDDTIFGGPGNDIIDAGAGDDHVVGGHWLNATDSNSAVNLGNYNASVKAATDPAGLPDTLHNVYDEGPIFYIDSTTLAGGGTISGQIWLDSTLNNTQAGDPLFTVKEVIVNLYDGAGNHVNSLVTTNGQYSFTGLSLKPDGTVSNYVVEFLAPDGYTFVSANIGNELEDSDAINGGRTAIIAVSLSDTSEGNVDAGLKLSNALPAPGSGSFEFSAPSYSVSENVENGVVVITIIRSNTFEERSVVVRTRDGAGATGAKAGINYTEVSVLLHFAIGEDRKTVAIPILDTDSIGFTDTLMFHLDLKDPTGRPLDNSLVYIYGDGAGTITDDDDIQGGNDWDIILGDSGYIPAEVVMALPATLATIVSVGGPGKDIIHGGNGPDYINAQLGNDTLAGDEGEDTVRGGMGDDVITAEIDDDTIDGEHGFDTVISDRDVSRIELKTTGATTATLIHKDSSGGVLSTFSLSNIEMAKLFGGYLNNTFDIQGWNGSAIISGNEGTDTLVVQNDTNMKLRDAGLLEKLLFLVLEGVLKDSSLSLPNGSTYHLAGLDVVKLMGGASANTLDASGYSRDAILEGLAGDDTLLGGSGDDRFVFVANAPLGTDTIRGNGQKDTVDFTGTTSGVLINLSQLSPTAQTINANLKLKIEDAFENVTGGSGNDTITGNSLDNVLIGGPGNDSLAGGAGSETYGFDTDSAWGTETIIENIADAGADTLDFSGTTSQVININLSVTDTVQVVNSNLSLNIVGEGIETVIGGSLADVIRGNSNNNTLRGGPGSDLLDGKSGNDILDGGAGNDDLEGGAGIDSITETANANFVLTDFKLTRSTGETDNLKDIEVAHLIGGSRANTFTLTGWTGSGSAIGGDNVDTVIMAADANFVLTDLLLTVSTNSGPIELNSIDAVVLTGGASANTLDASAFTGNATLQGGEGDDTLIGGAENDQVYGGPGNDTLTGGEGSDLLNGGAGSDIVEETRDAFRIVASADAIRIYATLSTDEGELDSLAEIEAADLSGGAATNLFDVTGWTTGALTIRGEGGDDIVLVRAMGTVTVTDSVINLGAGTINLFSIEVAALQGSEVDDDLNASAFTGTVFLIGNGGNDILRPGKGESRISGGAGDDRIIFTPNSALETVYVTGGEGSDLLDFRAFTTSVNIDLSIIGAMQPVVAGDLRIQLTGEDVENLLGGSASDQLKGNSLNNTITGGGGADSINGGGGTNTVEETADANMTLTNASLTINGVSDVLANVTNATLSGGSSNNTIDASAFTGATVLRGGAGNDILIGGAGFDRIHGEEGNDTLRGGGGPDIYYFNLTGPLGDDILDEAAGAAGGAETLDFSAANALATGISIDLGLTTLQNVHANLRLTILNANSIENIVATNQNDILVGNALDNAFIAGLGADTVNGRGGTNGIYEVRNANFELTNTQLIIGSETDAITNIQQAYLVGGEGDNILDAEAFTLGSVTLIGLAGNDELIGGSFGDRLEGREGNDIIFGGLGGDTLLGAEGEDTLNGGGGNDDLRGGAGNDTYVFDTSFALGMDTLTEFANGGFNDVLRGVGRSGIEVDLSETDPQNYTNLTLILANAGQVENSFP